MNPFKSKNDALRRTSLVVGLVPLLIYTFALRLGIEFVSVCEDMVELLPGEVAAIWKAPIR
jgi:hypothetical protein